MSKWLSADELYRRFKPGDRVIHRTASEPDEIGIVMERDAQEYKDAFNDTSGDSTALRVLVVDPERGGGEYVDGWYANDTTTTIVLVSEKCAECSHNARKDDYLCIGCRSMLES